MSATEKLALLGVGLFLAYCVGTLIDEVGELHMRTAGLRILFDEHVRDAARSTPGDAV